MVGHEKFHINILVEKCSSNQYIDSIVGQPTFLLYPTYLPKVKKKKRQGCSLAVGNLKLSVCDCLLCVLVEDVNLVEVESHLDLVARMSC